MKNEKTINAQCYFQGYFKKTAIELFDWHIILHYFWLSDFTHKMVTLEKEFDDPNTLCSDVTFLCDEHAKALESLQGYHCNLMHDPKVHSFPHEFEALSKAAILRKCDAEFQEESLKMFKKTTKKETPFFPDDPIKDYAVVYLSGNFETRERVPFKNKNSFHLLSIEARCLALLYQYFKEYCENLNFEESEFLSRIDSLKTDVIRDCNQLIGYWKLYDETKKLKFLWSKKGGKVSKKKEGIIESIKFLVQNGRENNSASDLWNYFRRNHSGEEKANKYGVFFGGDITGYGEDLLIDNDKPGIKFNTFRGIVATVKKELK